MMMMVMGYEKNGWTSEAMRDYFIFSRGKVSLNGRIREIVQLQLD